MRAVLSTRIGDRARAVRRPPGGRAGGLQHRRDARVGRRRASRPTTSCCTSAGAVPTACPGNSWQRSDRSSRGTGAIPGHSSRTRAACWARCSSRRARTSSPSAPTAPATRASAAPGACGAVPPDIRRIAWIDPDDEIAAAAAKIAADAGSEQLWTRALWRYNALHSYGKARAATRSAARHELGLRPARRLGCALRDDALRRPSSRRPLPSACSPTTRSPSHRPPPTTSRTASPTGGSWPCSAGSPQRHRIVVTVIRTGTRALRRRDAQGLEPLVRTRGDDQRGRRRGRRAGIARRGRALGRAAGGAQGVPARRDRRALVGPGQPSLVHRARRAGGDPRRLRRRRRRTSRSASGDGDVALHALGGVTLDGAVEVVGPCLRERDREARALAGGDGVLVVHAHVIDLLAVEQHVVRELALVA